MGRRSYTDDEKTAALELYAIEGPTAVQTRMGISKSTVAQWAKKAGVQTARNETAAARVEAARLTFEQRRIDLAHGLLDDIARLRGQLFAPTVKREAFNVSLGHNAGQTVEIHDIELDQPTFADKKALLWSIGVAVDKVQILSGAATQRTEILGAAGASIDDEVQRLAAELGLVPAGDQ